MAELQIVYVDDSGTDVSRRLPRLSDTTDWIILILILLGYELWGASRKLDKIQETLAKILEQLQQRSRQ